MYIADDDRPTHVLLTYEAYTRLIGSFPISDLLGQPVGVEDTEFVVPISDELARPALFE